jgi:uncharacterized membrane protein
MDKRGARRAAFALVLIALISSRGFGQTKDFFFPEIRIDIQIAKDGSFAVDEFRTFEFKGKFSWAVIWIPLRVSRQDYHYDARLDDFSVRDERGDFLRTETRQTSGRFEAKWFYSASNERRTFKIHYRIHGGVVNYSDVSELYWQPVGPETDKPASKVVITVHLPEAVPDKNDILVYGHGPLQGTARILDGQTALFSVEGLPSRQSVEIRMVWPAGITAGVLSRLRTRESIKQEEAHFVQETIARAKRTLAGDIRRAKIFRSLSTGWLVWLFLGPFAWIFIYLRYWKRVGRDYRFGDIPLYVHEPPSSLPPALVEVLLRQGSAVTPRSFTATIFDLATRGYLEIEDRRVEKSSLFGTRDVEETFLSLNREYRDDSSLRRYEKDLLDLLFHKIGKYPPEKRKTLTVDDLKRFFKSHPREFQRWYLAWRKSIKAETKGLRFIEAASLRTETKFWAVTVPLAALTLNPLLAVLGIALIPDLKRRAKPWARENEMWKALQRFVEDFGNFKDLPPEAYKLWDRYLVFSILFGNAKKIMKRLPVILQDTRSVPALWYIGFGRDEFFRSGGFEHMISSLGAMSSAIQSASTSAAHYSSGGGGGFSGGGGGGGGGGGVGAG